MGADAKCHFSPLFPVNLVSASIELGLMLHNPVKLYCFNSVKPYFHNPLKLYFHNSFKLYFHNPVIVSILLNCILSIPCNTGNSVLVFLKLYYDMGFLLNVCRTWLALN